MADYLMDLRKIVGTRPLLAVGTGVIVCNDNNEILLQLRSDTKDWGVPGGSLELGESLEQAAQRELYEETGLKAEHFTFLNIFSGESFYAKYPHGDEIYSVLALYEANGISGELTMHDDESLDLKYFPANNLPELNPISAQLLTYYIQEKHKGGTAARL